MRVMVASARPCVVIDLKESGGSGRHAKWNCLCDYGNPHAKNSQQIKAVLDKKTGHANVVEKISHRLTLVRQKEQVIQKILQHTYRQKT